MKYGKAAAFAFLILFVCLYAFSQAMQAAPDQAAAGKILAASQILGGERSLFSWESSLLELVLYLACVFAFRISALSGIAELTVFFVLLFCAGLWILRQEGMTDLCSALIWLAVCGLPNPEWLTGLRNFEGPAFFLLTAPFLLACWIRTRRVRNAAGLIGVFLLTFSKNDLTGWSTDGPFSVHGTLRALQKVFRADFSQMPLMSLSTGRFFLFSLILLLFLAVWTAVPFRLARGKQVSHSEICYAAAVPVTLVCSSLFAGNIAGRIRLCSWIPFGAAMLLILLSEAPRVKNLRAIQYRVPFSAVLCCFFAAAVLFGFSPIVRSRPASPADLTAGYLLGQRLARGACPEEDLALMTVAAKGRILFTADPDEPGNEFLITREAPELRTETAPAAVFSPYQVVILPH